MISDENVFSASGVGADRKRRVDAVSILMNLYVYPCIIVWTSLCIVISPVLYLIWQVVLRWKADRIIRLFIWIYGRGWIALVSPFITFRRIGFKDAPDPTPGIFAINHLSFFDTFCMALLPKSNVSFAVAAWPFKMLWFTPFMRLARYLDVQSLDWEEIKRQGRSIFDKGGSVLFFPEGHRSKDGTVKRFYSGAFQLSIDTGVPIVPLCITGTDTLLPPGSYWLNPAVVTFKMLPPVHPDDYEGPMRHKQLREHVKGLIKKEVTTIRREMK
jgi:1-acyl-sn-glycerol-3-phosphate acyltransferase